MQSVHGCAASTTAEAHDGWRSEVPIRQGVLWPQSPRGAIIGTRLKRFAVMIKAPSRPLPPPGGACRCPLCAPQQWGTCCTATSDRSQDRCGTSSHTEDRQSRDRRCSRCTKDRRTRSSLGRLRCTRRGYSESQGKCCSLHRSRMQSRSDRRSWTCSAPRSTYRSHRRSSHSPSQLHTLSRTPASHSA